MSGGKCLRCSAWLDDGTSCSQWMLPELYCTSDCSTNHEHTSTRIRNHCFWNQGRFSSFFSDEHFDAISPDSFSPWRFSPPWWRRLWRAWEADRMKCRSPAARLGASRSSRWWTPSDGAVAAVRVWRRCLWWPQIALNADLWWSRCCPAWTAGWSASGDYVWTEIRKLWFFRPSIRKCFFKHPPFGPSALVSTPPNVSIG